MMPPNALSHDFPQSPEVLPPFESRYHVQVSGPASICRGTAPSSYCSSADRTLP